MNSNQKIFEVKINNITAELEISKSKILCITGKTVHFEIQTEHLRAILHTRSNKIMLNFYKEKELFKTTIHSKHCLGIIDCLNENQIL